MSSPLPQLRLKTHEALAIRTRSRRGLVLWVNLFIVGLIAINSLAIILDTVPQIHQYAEVSSFLRQLEYFSILVFSLEYVLRVWSCVENKAYTHPITGRLRYMVSFWGLIDLLAILPFYVAFITADLGLIRILRVLRLVRLFRFSRYFHALRMIGNAIRSTKEELILSYAFVFFAVIICSSVIYYLEHPVQPELYPSIPASIWWGIVTMTTVGYGDVYPVTALGKLFGGMVAMLGVALFSLPTGIFASGFIDQINQNKQKRREQKLRCPHCGRLLSEHAPDLHEGLESQE